MRYIVNNDIPYFRVLYKAYIIEEVGVGRLEDVYVE